MSDHGRTWTSLGGQGQAIRASAPGRVNLMGEHTDYNDGYVLPMPIPQQTRVVLSARDDHQVFVTSSERPEVGRYRLSEEHKEGSWLDYVQGVTFALRGAGHTLRGFNAHFSSLVPMGAGLSSSAALEVALLRALREALTLSISDLDIARVARAAEVDFVGVPIGIMDQMASSLGKQAQALLIDTRTLDTEEVLLPDTLEVVVIASGVVHAHDGGEYAQRRNECADACAALGVRSLRDVSDAQLASTSQLPELLKRRARHVVTENARVLATVAALRANDLEQLKVLFAASHASMRDDYQVSVEAVDELVKIAAAHPEVVGARLTGGGFGGSVVMLARRGQGASAARDVAAAYRQQTRMSPSILLPQASV